MQLRTSLLCSTVLSLLPGAIAQAPDAPSVANKEASNSALQFTVGAKTVRRWTDAAGAHVAMSRDGGGSWVELAAPNDLVQTVHGSFDPLAAMPTYQGSLAVPAGTRLHIVQFHTQVLAEFREALQHAGVEVLHFLPANCLVVRADGPSLAAVQALPYVRWVGGMPNAWKLDAETQAFVNLVALGLGATAATLALVPSANGQHDDAAGRRGDR